jgi:hypothetical protein
MQGAFQSVVRPDPAGRAEAAQQALRTLAQHLRLAYPDADALRERIAVLEIELDGVRAVLAVGPEPRLAEVRPLRPPPAATDLSA